MRPTEFSADTIIALLRKQTIATLPEVMAALGPRASRRTAFRKLKDLDARTSHSHRGSYYTLDALADFDEHGLWSFAGVRFSRAGTLIATAESFVNHAEAGHFVDELDNLLGVGTQDPLRKLVGAGWLTRHKLAGQFLYCAAGRGHQAHQLRARRLLLATPGLVRPLPEADLMPEELRAAIVLVASLLDERQRRLFAGLEALKRGWGGDRRIAGLLGIDPSTVAAGRRQLVERDIEIDRVRRAGGERPPTENNAGSHRPRRSGDGPRNGRRPSPRPEDPLHLDPIRELDHRRSPRAQASGVRTGRVPRCGIHCDTPRDLRRCFCRLLQQRDVGIRLEQPLPAFRAAGDVPGDDLHGAQTGRGRPAQGAAENRADDPTIAGTFHPLLPARVLADAARTVGPPTGADPARNWVASTGSATIPSASLGRPRRRP